MALKVTPALAEEITSLGCAPATDIPTVADLSHEEVFIVGHTANPVPTLAIWNLAKLDRAMIQIVRCSFSQKIVEVVFLIQTGITVAGYHRLQ